MPYSLLEEVRVLELALLAPDLLGMHLADLGADVIKIEQPPGGDYLRDVGARKLAGLNLAHLRWNRGKRSLTLDLKHPEGRDILHRLAARSDVVIDGLRSGAAARCGADFETIRDRVLGARWMAFAPVSWCWPLPATATLMKIGRAHV